MHARSESTTRLAVLFAAFAAILHGSGPAMAQVAGQNINMVSGTTFPGGDPFLQRQNEPSIAVSSRNVLHLLAGANDYRTVDLPMEPGSIPGTLSGDAWLGVFKSFDGGLSWQSTLLPGYPQDASPAGTASPLKAYSAAADPTVRAGANGLLYYSGIAFNRGTNIGAVFLTRYFDRDAKENGNATQGTDTVPYLDTKLIDTGTSGQFLDKPWIAVDVPRSGSGATTCSFTPPGGAAQSFVGGNVYMTWSRFTGSSSTKIMFTRSLDCGKTWSNPIKISESNSINQGTNIAVDPANGTVYVAWRRFATSSQPDAIIVSKSTDFGQTFTSKNTVQVATIAPFDQGTSGTRFRTNALPSIAASVDGSGASRVHIAWAQRSATSQDGQIVVATSSNGLTWGAPVAVDSAPLQDDGGATFGRGHQLMPQLTFSQGRLMVLYYDQRLDHTLGLFTPNQPFFPNASGSFYQVFRSTRLEPPGSAPVFGLTIDDLGLLRRRHTVDLRVAEAIPGTTMTFSSTSVSQYKVGLRANLSDEEGNPLPLPITSVNQLQANAPNLPLFAQGTVPFLGDYIDIAGPSIVPNGTGGWKFNTTFTPAPVFYATWTDNRDVVAPKDGDWTHYTPPGSTTAGVTSVLDPTKTTSPCVPGQEGMRNQNVYSSRISEGLVVGSPQNIKPLFAAPKSRAFIVTLQNLTSLDRTFTMTLAPGTGVSASFQQTASTGLLTVTVPARSGAARPVFASSSNPAGSVAVNVTESGTCSGTCLSGSIVLNPEGSVSPLAQPDGSTTDIGTIEIYTPTLSIWNPTNPNPFLSITDPNQNISNQNISNQNISNADPAIQNISNQNISNQNISNQNISNPDPAVQNISNQNISNQNISNQNISNQNISNQNISNTTITDSTYAVTNSGNTTHSYRVALYGNNPTNAPLQLIVTKNYSSPTSVGCALQNLPQTTVLANVNNALIAPTLAAATDPNIPDGTTTNATMALAPGETAFVTLRGALTADQMAQLTRGLSPVVTAHGANTNATTNDFALLLFIQSTSGSLPAAVVGVPYSYTFTSVGGNGTITWTSTGTLPTGLVLSSGGLLSGTPSGAGSFTFTVTATDGSATPQTSTQSITMTVAARATSASALVVSPGAAAAGQPVNVTMTLTDSQGSGTVSAPSGTVTVDGGASVTGGSCTLSPTATAGQSSCTATVTPNSVATPPQATYTLTATYGGSATSQAASATAPLTVRTRATSTAVTFAPNPVTILTPTVVTATVTDIEAAGTASSPAAGLVTFSSTVAGDTFSALTCAPAPATATTSACAVTLTPSTNGARTVTASYGGTAVHSPSASGGSPTVKGNSTTTITSISPTPYVLGTPTTVSVTVAAAAPATGTPTGTVVISGSTGGTCTATLSSGAGSCSWTPAAGGSVTVTATYGGDAFFNGSATISAPLTVLVYYSFTGFLSPLGPAGTVSAPTFSGSQNLGSAVPLKWQLRDSSGAFLTSLATTVAIEAVLNPSCTGPAPTSGRISLYSPATGATGGSSFRYDTTNNQFRFNWDTSYGGIAAGCYTVILTLSDGSPQKATSVQLQ